jgi:Dolichyl-phosphate-mannose-protein mannosyltransferase
VPFLSNQSPAASASVLRRLPHASIVCSLLLVLGAAARLRQYLGCPSYWYDEAYLVLNVRDRSLPQLLGAIDYQVVIPPFFLWLLRGLYLFLGSSEYAMRLPSLLAGMAAPFLLVPLSRRFAAGSGWLSPAALCAVSAHALMHACEARPYATDLLATELVFWCALAYCDARTRWEEMAGGMGLLLLAVVLPWLSFPSVFVLGGTVLAAFLDASRRRRAQSWFAAVLLTALLGLSSGTLYYLSSRYLYYPGLREHWQLGFPDRGDIGKALAWTVGRLVEIGHYGIRGMGLPLGGLALLGLVVLIRRSAVLAVLLVGPVCLGLLAAFLHRYPMNDRTLFFAVPSSWLLASQGIQAVVNKAARGSAVISVVAFAALLAPETLHALKELVVVEPKADFRQAFAFVERNRQSGDSLWVTHAEVYQTYFGKEAPVLGHFSNPQEVQRAVDSGRLWMVCSEGKVDQSLFPEIFTCLSSSEASPLLQARFQGLRVLLCPKSPGRPPILRMPHRHATRITVRSGRTPA